MGKTTKPFTYDPIQIFYDYRVNVINRFKGLDLMETVPEKLWMEIHDIVQEAVIQTIPKKKKCRNAKWFSDEALQIAKKRSKRQKRKGRIYPFECRAPKNSKER